MNGSMHFSRTGAGMRWVALLADDIRAEDRRRGLRREASDGATELAALQAIADVGTKNMTSHVLAIRGERLVLVRTLYEGRGKQPEAFHTEVLRITEIDAHGRIAARVGFDLDDFEAAIAELDARYLAGEAAQYANTWSALAGAYAAFNRHEIPATPDWVNVDHRRATTVVPGDMAASIRATWDIAPNINRSIEAVHRLDNLGAVVTHRHTGRRKRAFDAEWQAGRTFHSHGWPDQPRRALRRGRPRRCACEVRTTQPPGAAAGKRGKPSGRAASTRASRPATGTAWRRW